MFHQNKAEEMIWSRWAMYSYIFWEEGMVSCKFSELEFSINNL